MMPTYRLVLCLLIGTACARRAVETVQVPRQPPPVEEKSAGVAEVLETARALVGERAVRVGGRTFRYDCSGFATGVYSVADVNLMSLGAEHPGANGVTLIRHYSDRFGELHERFVPSPGDLAYFDDTWDRNGNGRLDDPLTHVGVVESVDPDGTIHIIHLVGRGIVRDPMNLMRPHDRYDERGKPLNAWLRAKGRRDTSDTPRLMGELFAGFGTVLEPP